MNLQCSPQPPALRLLPLFVMLFLGEAVDPSRVGAWLVGRRTLVVLSVLGSYFVLCFLVHSDVNSLYHMILLPWTELFHFAFLAIMDCDPRLWARTNLFSLKLLVSRVCHSDEREQEWHIEAVRHSLVCSQPSPTPGIRDPLVLFSSVVLHLSPSLVKLSTHELHTSMHIQVLKMENLPKISWILVNVLYWM